MKVTLPCRHSFCLNCIKGTIVAMGQSHDSKCPLCNRSLSDQLKDQIQKNPQQIAGVEVKQLKAQDAYWFYASKQRGHWWAFDPSNSEDIEALYQRHLKGEALSE